jgi:pimeloyl-ACP methyl ester carboxylesterase
MGQLRSEVCLNHHNTEDIRTMRTCSCVAAALVLLAGCDPNKRAPGAGPDAQNPGPATSLAEARQGFKTKLLRRESAGMRVPQPPPQIFRVVHFESSAGKLAAYLSPDPKDGKKLPAIVWITGGDCNTIDAGCWSQGLAKNDQSAAQYRQAGIIMMFPSLRGGNDNPGVREGFLGEIEDVVAAADFLAKQPHVDPKRIYLGGHSTGGTVALLTAEYTDRFRAVFSFGPADMPDAYPDEYKPFNARDAKELDLRSPIRWLASIKSPTFVIEGANGGNAVCVRAMANASKNDKAHFLTVRGADHFSVLAPMNRLIAQKILADTEADCNVQISDAEVSKLFGR